MKLVSDFDGVLTELTHEAARVREIFLARLGSPPELGVLEEEMRKNPERHGWEVKGRVSAFSDEDMFIHTNALAAFFDQRAAGSPELSKKLAELQAAGFENFKALGEAAYDEMVLEVMAGKTSPIDPQSKPVLEGLLQGGTEITVISNSGSSRIQDIFNKSALPCTSFPAQDSGKICVRGGARKFELAPTARLHRFDRREVDVARPIYQNMIREERPDAVIGDVFSLDLAVPYSIAVEEPALFPRGLKLILRVRPYTPAWSLELCQTLPKVNSVSIHLLRDLSELPGILRS